MTILAHSAVQHRTAGCVAFILHAHLPYVRHLQEAGKLEERWFFEAMTETYIPLIDMFHRLTEDQVPFRMTMTITPTLLALMEDPLLQQRYEHYLLKQTELAAKEMQRLEQQSIPNHIARMYRDRWSQWLEYYRAWDRDIIAQFRSYSKLGYLDIMTCAATHAFLPNIMNEQIAWAQIEYGMREHARHFGSRPHGIWLPECGYAPHIAPLLHKCGIQYFVTDAHAIQHAEPAPPFGTRYPVKVHEQVYAFARDPQSSHQVWSSFDGYPGDADYREYYRDIGYDLGWNSMEEWEYIRPYLLPDGERIHTGLKYYRITGNGLPKQGYCEEQARLKAQEHAKHFIHSRIEQFRSYQDQYPQSDQLPILVSPYDAELFGHWWFEGPLWIEAVFRELNAQQHEQTQIQFCSLSDYIQAQPQAVHADLPTSSWGRGGYAEVWLMERNDWIYKHLHQAELRLLDCIHQPVPVAESLHPIDARIRNQAIRELMLAQSSDWAFIIDADTFTDYATNRIKEHLMRCHTLLDMLENTSYNLSQLEQMEREHPCFPSVDYRILTSMSTACSSHVPILPAAVNTAAKHILMLAWEFPPLVVGGLSRAVYDLARHLADERCEVHVITREVSGCPVYEVMNRVHVHRVPIPTSETSIGFMDWVLQMNAAFADCAEQLIINRKLSFDYLHAHDWLVYAAAHELKHTYRFPLITTIHATEYGRNHGALTTELQHRIHEIEHMLVQESDHVIVCSQAMVHEIHRLFQVPHACITMIPNGVDCSAQLKDSINATDVYSIKHQESYLQEFRLKYAENDEFILFFIGRLVYEKGIHVLLQALPLIIQQVHNVQLLIAGSGPMQAQLQSLIHELQLEAHVRLLGFVHDEDRDKLFQIADVCVFPSLYEPFGIVALEAMGTGTPVVVSDIGGLAEIIAHDRDGFKALPGHAESLAWHTAELLLDRDKAAQFASEAKRKVLTQYDWHSIAESTQKVYEGVMV